LALSIVALVLGGVSVLFAVVVLAYNMWRNRELYGDDNGYARHWWIRQAACEVIVALRILLTVLYGNLIDTLGLDATLSGSIYLGGLVLLYLLIWLLMQSPSVLPPPRAPVTAFLSDTTGSDRPSITAFWATYVCFDVVAAAGLLLLASTAPSPAIALLASVIYSAVCLLFVGLYYYYYYHHHYYYALPKGPHHARSRDDRWYILRSFVKRWTMIRY
jgi:hypothetical protein